MAANISATRDEDLLSLQRLFTDVDPSVIAEVYAEHDGDVSECMQALGSIATHAKGRGEAPIISPPVQGDDPSQRSLAGDFLSPRGSATSRASSLQSSGLPQYIQFDVSSLSTSFQTIGTSVSQGVTTLMNSVTGWVSDLASTFDTGWDEDPKVHSEGERDQRPTSSSPVVDSDHCVQRRAVRSISGRTASEELHGEDDEDDKKDL